MRNKKRRPRSRLAVEFLEQRRLLACDAVTANGFSQERELAGRVHRFAVDSGLGVLQSGSTTLQVDVTSNNVSTAGHAWQIIAREGTTQVGSTGVNPDGSSTLNIQVPINGLSAGLHTIAFDFRNLELNQTLTMAQVTLFVDLSNPTLMLPPNGIVNSAVSIMASDDGAANSGLIDVRLTDSNAPNQDFVNSCQEMFSTSYQFNGVQGVHTITVTATDRSGRITEQTRTYTFDTVPPTNPANLRLVNDTDTPGDNVTQDPRLTFDPSSDATTGVARYEANVNNGGFQSIGLDTTFTPTGTVSGFNTVVLRAVDNAGNISGTTSFQFVLDNEPPTQPVGLRLVNDSGASDTDRITNDAELTFLAVADAVRYEVRVNGGALVSIGTANTFTPAGLQQGANTVEVRSVDAAGNPSPFTDITFTFDTVAPTAPVDVELQNDSGQPTDNVTNDSDIQFDAASDATSGVERYEASVNGAGFALIGTSLLFDPQDLVPVSDGAVDIDVRAVDVAGNIGPAAPFTFTLDTAAPVVTSFEIADVDRLGGNLANLNQRQVTFNPSPAIDVTIADALIGVDNSVLVELTAVDGAALTTAVVQSLALPFPTTQGDASLAIPIVLGAGQHTATLVITDLAGNSATVELFENDPFFVVVPAVASGGAAGTPVFTSFYDLSGISSAALEQPWTQTFDARTQTSWFTMEEGRKIAQFDPASERLVVYDVNLGANSANPHGIFFDFDTHIHPRVWFTHRNGRNFSRLTYLDVVDQTFRSLDTASIAEFAELKAVHFVITDTRGHVWAASEENNTILELDFDLPSDNDPNANTLDNIQATLTVREIPTELLPPRFTEFEPHGLQVVVSDKPIIETDANGVVRQYVETFLWFSAQGDSGQIALLHTFQQVSGPDLPKPDEWVSWDVTEILELENRDGHALFIAVDDNETPGDPLDDRIIFSDPEQFGQRDPAGSIRMLDPSGYFADRNSATSPIQSWRVLAMPGAPVGDEFAATVQPFVDREGSIFFADARAGAGRIDADAADDTLIQAPIRRVELDRSASTVVEFSPFDATVRRNEFDNRDADPTNDIPVQTNLSDAFTVDRSIQPGIDHYEVSGPANGRGQGIFRAFLNAGNVLFGSVAQNDLVATTVFAEASRRQMTAVASPFALPDGYRVRGRLAFQVLRDGSLIQTGRGDGQLVDRQENLSLIIAQAQGFDFDDLQIEGDTRATVNPQTGVVHVFGRNKFGGLIEFRFTPPAGSDLWVTDDLFDGDNWSVDIIGQGLALPAEATAFMEAGVQARAVTTDASGHLLLYTPNSAGPIDLTALAAEQNVVFSTVGVTQQNNTVFIYATNQRGDLVEYSYPAGDPISVSSRIVAIPAAARAAGQTERDTMVLQNVSAITAAGSRHVFAVDGRSQLVHIELNAAGDVVVAENVTRLIHVDADNRAFGYFDFQEPYVARTYTYVSPIVTSDGSLIVYGTDAANLIEFTRDANGWRVGNLTQDLRSTDGISGPNRQPANEVFGAPAVYIQPNGERHVLMINADSEVVEYYTLAGEANPRIHTQNITLLLGNDVRSLSFPISIPNASEPIDEIESEPSFRNPRNRMDVNDDGRTTAQDALLVLRELKSRGPQRLTSALRSSDSPAFFVDVDGDGIVTPADALAVITHLVRHGASGEGLLSEGESMTMAPIIALGSALTPEPKAEFVPGDPLPNSLARAAAAQPSLIDWLMAESSSELDFGSHSNQQAEVDRAEVAALDDVLDELAANLCQGLSGP